MLKLSNLLFKILTKSMAGKKIARQLLSVLSASFGIKVTPCYCCRRDGASINNVAMGVLKAAYRDVCHTDLVGDKFSTLVLSTFSTLGFHYFLIVKTKAL